MSEVNFAVLQRCQDEVQRYFGKFDAGALYVLFVDDPFE
jgi:hypothetical protein